MSSGAGLINEVSGPSRLESTRDSERVKTKIERSKTACLQCRSRRSKCGATPPGPCPYCIKARVPCKWPSDEDRPKRGRRPKRQRGSESYDEVLNVGATSTSPRRCGRSETCTSSSVVGSNRSATTLNYANPFYNTTQSDIGVNTAQSTGNRLAESTTLPRTSNLPTGLSRSQAEYYTYRDLFDLFATPPISPTVSPHGADVGSATGIQYNLDRPPVSEVSELNSVGNDVSQADASILIASNSNGALPTVTRAAPPAASLDQWGRSHQPSTWNTGDAFNTWSQDSQNITMTSMPENDIGPSAHPWAFTPVPSQPAQTLYPIEFDSQGFPSETMIQHLLDLFYVHFSCQFPFITLEGLEYQFMHGRRSLFLFYVIAAVSARFSTHPEIALPHLQPHSYGQVFYGKAISLVGSSMGVPSRENIFAFVLLTLAAFGNDSEVQVGILAGIAVRLTLQMDLHLKPSEDSKMSKKDCRVNRLLFWSVLMLDYTLCFGERRTTTILPEVVTQDLPREADLHPQQDGAESNKDEESEEQLRSPFPYAAQTMFALGALNNLLLAKGVPGNGEQTASETKLELGAAWEKIARQYDELPLDMIWTAGNLQWHYRAHSGPMYLSLHLWNYTIQAFRYLADTPRSSGEYAPSGKADQQVPLMSIQAESWLHCARFIGEILVLADVVDPNLYLAIPLVSHCFYEAVCCFAKDKEIRNRSGTSSMPNASSQAPSSPNSIRNTSVLSENGSPQTWKKEQSRKLFAVITVENIATIKQGLNKQAIYWQSGICRVQRQLDRRLASVSYFDVMGVSERVVNNLSLRNGNHLKGWLGSRLGDQSRVPAHRSSTDERAGATSHRNHVPPTLSSADTSVAHNEGLDQVILSDHVRDPPQPSLSASEDGIGDRAPLSPAISNFRIFNSIWDSQEERLGLVESAGQFSQILRDLGIEQY